MTAAQALSAHASAQMQAARAADNARRAGQQAGSSIMEEAPHDFIEGWGGCKSHVIGMDHGRALDHGQMN